MRFDPRGWIELIRSLGEALVGVFVAEILIMKFLRKISSRFLGEEINLPL